MPCLNPNNAITPKFKIRKSLRIDLIGFISQFKDDKTCENYLTKRLFPKKYDL